MRYWVSCGALSVLVFWVTGIGFAAEVPQETGSDVQEEPTKPVKVVVRPKRDLTGDEVEFTTSDGWLIKATYLPAEAEQPTFILLHEARGRRQNWYWLAARLRRAGVGYLAIDFRGHGLSTMNPEGEEKTYRDFTANKKRNDYEEMREDVAAGVAFLKDKGLADGAIHIGGAEAGGSIGLKFAALHPEIGSIFLLSPGFSVKGIMTVNAMKAYKERPILIASTTRDRKSMIEASILYEFAKRSAGAEYATQISADRGQGTRMLYYSRDLRQEIVDWIDDPYRAIDIMSVGYSTGSVPSALPQSFQPGAQYEDGLPSDVELQRIANESGE
jgi:pimeloyl-ACP methyl ester carboxylesterase